MQKRVCHQCGNTYDPDSPSQQYCQSCGIIRREAQRNRPALSAPKSKAGIRPVPLLPELESILRESLPTDANLMDEYIVSGKTPYSERQYRNRMERILKSINLHGATAHILRHTFCTMAAGHTDIKTLQTMAGHSKISMTMDRYTHGLDSRVQEQAMNLSGMYNRTN